MEEIQIRHADDVVIFGSIEKNLQENVIGKKTMIIGNESLTHNVKIEGTEQTCMFKHLGGNMNSRGTLEDEINERTAKTRKLYNAIQTSFLSKIEISQEVKAEVVRRVLKPILAHSCCESWTTNERQRRKMNNTEEMRFLKRIKNKTRLDGIRNELYIETN